MSTARAGVCNLPALYSWTSAVLERLGRKPPACPNLINSIRWQRACSPEGMPEVSVRHPPLIVVSNREPYLHVRRTDGSIATVPTTGGVSVALDALMRERGGTWIAHGAGNADAEMVDANDRVTVPPDAPSYTLRRVWLSADEEKHYYNGFANEGLWPLSHTVHVRPRFRSEDWRAYRRVNARFAETVASELTTLGDPGVHPGLSPCDRGGRAARARAGRQDGALLAHPLAASDRLRMCPWRREILRGLLANDLLAFQLESDRRNFLLGVSEELDADVEEGAVTLDGRRTR